MKCSTNPKESLSHAEEMVREAAANGANVILLPELFEREYFCQQRRYDFYQYAKTVEENKAVQMGKRLAKELQVVLPISFYEKDVNNLYNSVACIDADGTLLGVYDVRYNSSVDLQEYVDVGLSRSTDGGKTWEKMRLPLSFGEYDGLPAAQNGVGDPSILVDTQTNTIWVVAAWTHGMGNQRAWWSSHPGMDMYKTAQLVMAKSTDDGKTWSKPINITDQVKDPSWYFLLQGPGRGITMSDGTLVFPTQFIDSTRIPNAGIMYSKDRGKTWKMHNLARTNTTEAQVVEIEPGVLMLNMRDNRGGSRAVAITKDLGKTWTEHPSSRKALQEPVCMASLIQDGAKDNVLDKDILLFSNPNTTKGRNHITIKASLDGGVTWLPEHQLMLDE